MPTGPLNAALIRKRFLSYYEAYVEKRKIMVAEIDKLSEEGLSVNVDNLPSRPNFILARGHFIEAAEALAEVMRGEENAT